MMIVIKEFTDMYPLIKKGINSLMASEIYYDFSRQTFVKLLNACDKQVITKCFA